MQQNSHYYARTQRTRFAKVVRAKTVTEQAAGNQFRALLNAHDTCDVLTLSRIILINGEDTPIPNCPTGDELVLVENGCARLCIGLQTIELGKGEIALLRRDVAHVLTHTGSEPATVFCWMFRRPENTGLAGNIKFNCAKIGIDTLDIDEATIMRRLISEPKNLPQVPSITTAEFNMTHQGEEACREASGARAYKVIAPSEVESHFCAFEVETPPLGGAPWHVHERQDRVFLVRTGRYEFCLDDARLVVEAGDVVWAPCGVPHSYRVVSPCSGRLFVVSIWVG